MFKNQAYTIETSWEELSPDKFTRVAIALFNSANDPIQKVRLKILGALLGKQFKPEEAGCKQRLAELTKWVFDISVNEDILDFVSPELREALTYCMPDEVDSIHLTAELERVYSLLNSSLKINLKVNRNPLPGLIINRKILSGPFFNVDSNGILETDVTAGEFLDAAEYMQMFSSTHDTKYLANVASCLYRDRRKPYVTFDAQKQSHLFENHNALAAIWFLFISWQQYFQSHPVFGILFSEPDPGEHKKISLGSYELIFSFAHDGYGSIDNIAMMPITDFFSLQVKTIKDAVSQYRAMEKKDGEIAKLLKIPYEIVTKL